MNRRSLPVLLSFAMIALLIGCGGHHKETVKIVDLPLFTGWFWHLISFLAIVGVAYLVNQKGEANEDSLFKLGNRLRQLEDRLEELQKGLQSAVQPKAEDAAVTKPAAAKGGAKKKDDPKSA